MSWPPRCPSDLQLSVALSDGASERLSAHVDVCPRCGARWRELSLPRDLARALPILTPTSAELEQTRTRLLIALGEQQGRRGPEPSRRLRGRVLADVAAGAALAAALILAWRMSPAPLAVRPQPQDGVRTHHATVHPQPGAALEL